MFRTKVWGVFALLIIISTFPPGCAGDDLGEAVRLY